MGGENPYLKAQKIPRAEKPFKVSYSGVEKPIDVSPEKIPYGRTGRPGSLLDIALGHDIEIDHACGGVAACSTCHVIVRQGFETMPEATEDEEDQLDNAPGLTPQSRLACQAVPDGS